jgi:hypothetical protein
VKLLRSKNFQRLGLVAIRDGDAVGLAGRKVELEEELDSHGLERRSPSERIATPVPTWSIETWLLFLNGHNVVETESLVKEYESHYRDEEELAIRNAADAWVERTNRDPNSLQDGKLEMGRLDQ